MGQVAYMERSDRFIREFGTDYVSRSLLQPGDVLTVKSTGLGQSDLGQDVRQYVLVTDAQGREHELAFEDIIFSPDVDEDEDDTVARLSMNLDITEQEARARVKKAQLF